MHTETNTVSKVHSDTVSHVIIIWLLFSKCFFIMMLEFGLLGQQPTQSHMPTYEIKKKKKNA